MKNIVKATALSLALAFTATASVAAENIAFIDAAYLIQNHPDSAEVGKKLDKEFATKAKQLESSKKSIDGKIAALQKEAKNLRKGDIQKREAEINKLMKEHDAKVAKFQQEAQRAEREEQSKILTSIQKATNDIAKEKGYTYVLEAPSVVYAAEGKDITEDVLKALGGKVEAPKAEETKPAETK